MMTILAVDPDPMDLKILTHCLSHLHPGVEVRPYTDPMLAVQYGANRPVGALYTSIDMKRLDGFDLTKLLRKKHPDVVVNLIGEDDRHRSDAIRIMANSYLVKLVTLGRMREAEAEW